MKRSTGLKAGFWTTQRLVSHFSESGGHLEPEPSRWALPKPRLGPMKDKPGHTNHGPGHTIRSRRNLESCPAGWTSTPPLLVAPFELTRDTEAARISPMSFSPLELFLLLVAIIGPLKPTVILASAASSSGADPTAVRSVLLVGLAVELMFVGLNSWGVVSIEGLKASG